MPLTRPTSATSTPGAPAGVVTPPSATSEAVASGGSVTNWTFGAFTDPDGRISSYSATLVTVTGSGSLSGTGLGPYSITGTTDGAAYTVELDALDGDGGVLATAVHTVTIEGEGLVDPTYTAPSAGDYVIGGYHDFDGVDERIGFGDLAALDFDYATDTFTVSAWVNPRSGGIPGQFWFGNAYGLASGNQGAGWAIGGSTSAARFFFYNTSSSFFHEATIATNTWTHVLWVFTAGGTMTLYKNGVLTSTLTSGSFTPPFDYTNTEVTIGELVQTGAACKAYLAEVAVWSSDQSANVAAIYNSRARHNLMDLAAPPDVFYAPLTIQGDDPGSGGSVAELVANNDGAGVNMETADAVFPTAPTTVTSTLTKAKDLATSVVTTTKVEDVPSGATGGTGSSFP